MSSTSQSIDSSEGSTTDEGEAPADFNLEHDALNKVVSKAGKHPEQVAYLHAIEEAYLITKQVRACARRPGYGCSLVRCFPRDVHSVTVRVVAANGLHTVL